MERLTKQNVQNDGVIVYSSQKDCRLLRCETNQKLGKLEDLEEQLNMSIDLVTALNIMLGKQFIYIIRDGYVYELSGAYTRINDLCKNTIYVYFHKIVGLNLNYLGKEFWFTREEAEKKLEELKNENI